MISEVGQLPSASHLGFPTDAVSKAPRYLPSASFGHHRFASFFFPCACLSACVLLLFEGFSHVWVSLFGVSTMFIFFIFGLPCSFFSLDVGLFLFFPRFLICSLLMFGGSSVIA